MVTMNDTMNNDLISRSTLLRTFCNDCGTSGKCRVPCVDYDQVVQAPAVDAEIVRHGRWIPNKVGAIETEFKCSECGRTVTRSNDLFGKASEFASHTFPYCHCGAKMNMGVEV